MEKYISIILLLIPTVLTAQWNWQYPKPQGNTLNDIFIFDSTTAVAVGELGTVIKTYDGGLNWSVKHHAGGTDIDLYSVHFIDTLNGWAAGGIWWQGESILLKTEDGGKNWIEAETGMKTKIDTTLPLSAVYFVDADTGFAVGEDGILLRTTDGGENWDVRKIDDYVGYGWLDVFRLNEITFTDKQTGWIVGLGYYGNQIYKTTDCGRTWQWNEQIITPKFYGSINDICFIDKDNGYIIGDMGCFAKTTDGGVTWEYQDLSEKYQKDEYQYFYSTFFTDSLNGWIVGGDYYAFILKTTDGGENWIEEANNDSKMIHHFYKTRFSDRNNGWIIGQFGMIYKTTDTGVSWSAQRDDKYGFSSIYFIDENTGWAVGDSGIIMQTENGGTNWYKQNQNDSLLLSSVFAIDDQNVFVVGSILKGNWPSYTSNGIILSSYNSGQNWTRQQFDTLGGFNSIIFINDSLGLIASSAGILLRTTNKGNVWEYFSSGLGAGLNKIQFANHDIGWISFYNGNKLLKTIDGGQNWEMQFIDSSFSMSSFYFVDSNNGWAVGPYDEKNNIYKTSNGGLSWALNEVPTISDYSYVYFINNKIGWLSGSHRFGSWLKSIILKTINGGDTWMEQACPSINSFSSIYFVNENTGWATGDGIFKTSNGGGVVFVNDQWKNEQIVPEVFYLYQNYPNPFNPLTIIKYELKKSGFISIKVYDILGREVTTLVNEYLQAGDYSINFNASSVAGGLSSGIYFYRLTTGNYSVTHKMVFIK